MNWFNFVWSITDETGDTTEGAETDDNNKGEGEDGLWRSNALTVPSERIQFQITLEEGESGNEEDD